MDKRATLEYLWYIIPGAFLVLPINVAAVAATGGGLAPEINVLLAFALGYIVHQMFRGLKHRSYALGDRPAIRFMETLLDEKLRRDINKKMVEKKKLTFLDLVYNYCIFSNPKFEHRINLVKRKSFFSIAAGVSFLGLILGGCLFLMFVCLELSGILPQLEIGDVPFNTILSGILIVSAVYFLLSCFMGEYHGKLEKDLNRHEITLVKMEQDEIKNVVKRLVRDEAYLKEIMHTGEER